MTEPDDIIRRVSSSEPMSVAELQRAHASLGRYVQSGRPDVLAARLRVAIRLEQLGA
ncbi:hypothetical protein [Geodermatophilus sp. URMC 64]